MASSRSSNVGSTLGCLVVIVVLLAIVGIASFVVLRERGTVAPVVFEDRCVATANGNSVAVDLDQAHYTAIIVGLAVRRDLPPRAGSIAMATVYQETGIRNLDYGDRDSVGLFQQRPSQGWGSEKQLMDPYYATGKFYDALVKIPNWQSADINDVAQAVQRSGFPEAYRDHEPDGRILASVFTGHSKSGLKCQSAALPSADVNGLRTSLSDTFGSIRAASQDGALTIRTSSATTAWAVAYHAQANASRFGVASVHVGDKIWQHRDNQLTGWEDADSLAARTVVITLAG